MPTVQVDAPATQRVRWSKKTRALSPQKLDRAWHAILHRFAGVPSAEVAKQTGLHVTTIRKWRRGYRRGGTRYPKYESIAKALHSIGMSLEPVTNEEREGIERARDGNQ